MADYISREAAIEELCKAADCASCSASVGGFCGFCTIDNAARLINGIPTADVEPVRHGRWKYDGYYRSWSERIICSECGHFGGTYAYQLTPYCPHCGAKMQEGIYRDD